VSRDWRLYLADIRTAWSKGSVSKNAGNTVKVRVIAGEILQASVLHQCNEKRVVGQQSEPTADFGCLLYMCLGDEEYAKAKQENACYGLMKTVQFLNMLRMATQSSGDTLVRPAKR
jgi:hypothetical protein